MHPLRKEPNEHRRIGGLTDHGGPEPWGNHRVTFRRTGAGWPMAGVRYSARANRGNEYARTHTR